MSCRFMSKRILLLQSWLSCSDGTLDLEDHSVCRIILDSESKTLHEISDCFTLWASLFCQERYSFRNRLHMIH